MNRTVRSNPIRLRPAPRCALAWVLLMALLAVQTLGVLHRIAHVDVARLQATAAESAVAGRTDVAESPRVSRGWPSALFAGHAGGRDCDAFDQMSHGDAAVATALDLGTSPPAMAPDVDHPAWHLAAQACGFLARGPPIAA